ncbi:MAG: TlpA family protein disulfide reductase [Phocaeicola sp.]|uniref:TlpA family protein disulfide reductase n=1 Tax=Phocaeicola sp. TaxID=2773926 RepID=UPI0023D630D7|nr:TlpA disulfide reductase family protein [Phocaeicola sp.]MDE5677253.1 TlpA family protein disulfide reductase [Phocaeicola sp.]MDE6181417.1 TlpA family protein disulfide reductase [Phocaeicola sp.]
MKIRKLSLWFMMLCMAVAIHAQDLKKGDELPEFQLQSAVYGNVSSADLKGKVVLVSLFATWCGPCQLELAEVEKTLWPKYKDDKDFVLLVVGREHTDEQLKAYNERKKFTFPLYPDPKREVFSLFAEKSIPRAYLFNKEGKAVYTSIGYEKEEFGRLMSAIAEALK